jgi:hypothetical protein
LQDIPSFTSEFVARGGPEALERLAVLSIENQLQYQGLVQGMGKDADSLLGMLGER